MCCFCSSSFSSVLPCSLPLSSALIHWVLFLSDSNVGPKSERNLAMLREISSSSFSLALSSALLHYSPCSSVLAIALFDPLGSPFSLILMRNHMPRKIGHGEGDFSPVLLLPLFSALLCLLQLASLSL